MKRVLIANPGQSNFVGNAKTNSRTGPFGFPLVDPVGPQGYARSVWPVFSEQMGKRGVYTKVHNIAHGSSSIKDHWLGRIKAYAAGTIYYGQLCLSGGGIWRANLAAGAYQGGTTAGPTGTSNVTVDSVPWVYLGVPQSYEVDGYICRPGDANFDPLGYTAAAYNGLMNDPGVWDEKWLFTEFGQQECLTVHATTRAEFALCLQIMAGYFLAAGVKVAIGLSCWPGNPTNDAKYSSFLIPGRQDALDSFAGNPNVCAGANWRETLGILPIEATAGDNYPYPAMRSDTLHFNDAASVEAAFDWVDALAAAGWA